MRTVRCLLLALLVGSLAIPTASALGSRQSALGSDGEVYRIVTGTYGQFFPAGLVPAANSVLVLEIIRPGVRSPTRLLVPGTETDDVELAASISLEDDSRSLTVIWASQRNYIHSRINLAVLNDGRWSQTIELSGDAWSLKSSPAVAVTRDTFVSDRQDGPVAQSRTIYHVVWWEEAGSGDRIVYSPLVFLDGNYTGSNSVFVLTDLVSESLQTAAPLPNLRPELVRTPTVQSGSTDTASVVVGFVHPTSGKLVSLQLSPVPGSLALLASEVEADLANFAVNNPGADGVALGERARHQIVEFGVRLGMHPGFLQYVASTLESDLHVAGGENGAAALGERARHQIVEFGVRMLAQGFSGSPDSAPAWLAELPAGDAGSDGQTLRPVQAIRLRLAQALTAPETDAAPTSLFLSPSGSSALVAWYMDPVVRYYESNADGSWSGLHRIRLSADLSLEHVLDLLEARVSKR